jgi:hypothetical protein
MIVILVQELRSNVIFSDKAVARHAFYRAVPSSTGRYRSVLPPKGASGNSTGRYRSVLPPKGESGNSTGRY